MYVTLNEKKAGQAEVTEGHHSDQAIIATAI